MRIIFRGQIRKLKIKISQTVSRDISNKRGYFKDHKYIFFKILKRIVENVFKKIVTIRPSTPPFISETTES